MDDDELSTLLGAYYHEDFEGIWPTFALYLRDSTTDDLIRLSVEIDTFLRETVVTDVAKETWRLGSCLWLGEEPAPYVEWLQEMRRRAIEAARSSKSV